MTNYQVVTGWGYNTEQVVGDEMSRSEARELYEELHTDWLETWSEDDIESEQAQMERPWLCCVDDNGDREIY
jgi:hypothetical protein